MKTSNKALLLLIITIAAFTISVPVILRHQLSASRYTKVHSDEDFEFDRKVFGTMSVVCLNHLNHATVVPSDTLKVDIERTGLETLEMDIRGDTLDINGTGAQWVRVFLPEGVELSSAESRILVRGGLDRFDSLRMHIKLSHSRMKIEPVFKDQSVPQFWDQLILSGSDSSTVSLSGAAMINRMEVTNVTELKLGDRIFVDNMVISYSNKKSVHSASDENGLLVRGF
jgi:hypothetical protein